MTLDVHIANTLDDVTHIEPLASIDIQTHASFYRGELLDGFPLLQRMKDYHSDCCFARSELETLLAEIDGICNRLSPASPYQSWMQELRDVCAAAVDADCSIFVASD